MLVLSQSNEVNVGGQKKIALPKRSGEMGSICFKEKYDPCLWYFNSSNRCAMHMAMKCVNRSSKNLQAVKSVYSQILKIIHPL